MDMQWDVGDYSKQLDQAESWEDVQAALSGYPRWLVDDAIEAAKGDWSLWKKGLTKERKGIFAGAEWAKVFGPVLQPGEMLRVALIADQFKVPFALAMQRYAEHKGLPLKDQTND